MKTEKYTYQPETLDASESLFSKAPHSVSALEHKRGLVKHEPLIVILDSCVRYAKAHRIRFESPLFEDYVLGPAFEQVLEGVQALLDGDGALSNELESPLDSKANAVCSGILQECRNLAGFPEI
jgi:hypothetical protein